MHLFVFTTQTIIHTTEVGGADDPQEGRQEEETQEVASLLQPVGDEAEDPDQIVSVFIISIGGKGKGQQTEINNHLLL